MRAIILVPTTDLAQQVLLYERTAPPSQPLTTPHKSRPQPLAAPSQPLTPPRARQVVRLARQVAGPMPLRVALCTSEFPMATQRSKLGGGVELCVATLGRLQARGRRRVGWRGAAWGDGRGAGGVGGRHGARGAGRRAGRVECVRVRVPLGCGYAPVGMPPPIPCRVPPRTPANLREAHTP